ncbi:MAG TPA: isoprenylcysteine carboxylmethyltransferase family protein [Rhodanobacteraceae bacterium]|jgi:protein-S-isoprenylcysteine O-methyltransferase Ste14|nr:isoprenylcysteine carboxylmethyltransferase family protein [Rhodanobacteraceae bacterium]
MPALIAHSHFHHIVLYVAVAVCYGPEWIGTFFQNPERGAKGRDRGSYAVLLTMIFVGVFLAFFAAFGVTVATITWQQPVVFWAGIVLMLAGTAFRWYAIRKLGRFFTRSVATRAGQFVVDTGPYRWIRHPSYSGALLTMLGLGLALTNWLSVLLVLVASLIGYVWRVHVEEQALCADLGQPYRDYMQRTKRFVPRIW